MDFIRIQDKIISWQRIEKILKKALHLRERGLSQQEVADRLRIDRTFISRLEGIGELRKGQSIACIGFPIKNKEEIQQLLRNEGVEYSLLLTEQERQDFVNQRSGNELLNEITEIITRLRRYQTIIIMGSDQRVKLMEGVLDSEIIPIELGKSPLTEDKWVDIEHLKKVLRAVKSAR